MISTSDYFMGRDKTHASELTQAIRDNAAVTVARVNGLLSEAKVQTTVSSGWRPPAVNAATKGAAKKSKHMTGEACDLRDPKGDLGRWCLENLDVLERHQLWLEHPSRTQGWVHLQIRPPNSGSRVFYP